FILFASITGFAKTEPTPLQQRISELFQYRSAIVSYLGPEGTYTQEACEKFFGKRCIFKPFKTVNDAVKSLNEKNSNYAVIPQENTIGGAVIDYIDTLITQTNVSVVGEVELPINQNLLALKEAKLSDIKKVYSHKQGIAQGKDWIKENLPDAEVIEVSSTAAGAKMVSESQDISCAAIASVGSSKVYKLNILARNIQNNDNNKTRFYILSLREPSLIKSDRLAFIATGSAKDLPALMQKMKELQMKLIAIHDRPQKTVLGQYHYLIECSDIDYDSYKKLIDNSPFKFRYLGSFEVK
ncbi:MAG: hypothetical protein IKO19_06355, partial [Candidatus Riflebacteria bacterium]|nr:hypothetical protein [Candidatus Riflebacteria bacterium]